MAQRFNFMKRVNGTAETFYPKTATDNVVKETPNGEKKLDDILDEKGAFMQYTEQVADESTGNDLLFEILGDVIDSEIMESIKGTIVSPVAPSDTKYLWIDTSTTPYVLKCYDINHNKWISVSIGGGTGNGYIMGDSEPSDYTVLWIDTSGGQYILKCHDSNDNTWKSITTNSSISQFRTYSELLEEFTKENPSLDVSEGSVVIVKETETISNENEAEIIEYPSGLYRYNSETTKWEHQDYLLRKEFKNHAEDSIKHVSVANRTAWNNKADGNFESNDIDISSSAFTGHDKYIVDSAYLYAQLIRMKSTLDKEYETIENLKEHEGNAHTDVLHLTNDEKSKIHTHVNQKTVLDKLSSDINGNLLFNGVSVSAGKVAATKSQLGQVIIGDGISVDTNGTISIDWYKSTDNGDGTSTVVIGGIELVKNNTTGQIQGSVINGIEMGATTVTDSDGNQITVERIGGIVTTTTIASDKSSTIVSDNNGTLTITKKNSSGDIIYTMIGDSVVYGTMDEISPIQTEVDDVTGDITETVVSTTTTPSGKTQTTTIVVTSLTGETTSTITTLHSSGNDVNIGVATGERVIVKKNSSGDIIDSTTELLMTIDGKDNTVREDDISESFDSMDELW